MNTVRIVAIGDTHTKHRQLILPEGDILVHTGDFMNSGEDFRNIIDFNFWLAEQKFDHKVVIAGNHDRLFENQSSFARSLLTSATYLENSGVDILGLKFWGSPFTPEFCGWSFMRGRGVEMAQEWKKIPRDLDVLLVHGPPFGFLDQYEGKHVGCEALAVALYRRNVRIVLCGHIHPGHGRAEMATESSTEHPGWPPTLIANVAVLDAKYQLAYSPTVIDVPVTRHPDWLPDAT